MNNLDKTERQVTAPSDSSIPHRRFTLKLSDHLDSADKKKYYNEQLFTEIAPRYNFITRSLSFWRDASWKRDLIATLPPQETSFCVDLACGTGDISLLLAQKYPNGQIVGVDITESMLAIARARNPYPPSRLQFVNEDMGNLSFPPESADIVSGGYALRNAPDLATTLEGIHAVLKPGGIAAFLDFSKPVNRFLQVIEYWLLKIWTGFWGLFLHRNHEVYGYIAESLLRFPDREELRQLLENKGFTIISSELYFFGITEVFAIQKKPE